MITPDKLDPIKELLQPAGQVLVILGKNATLDQVSAAQALNNALQSFGKQTVLISPAVPSSEITTVLNGELPLQDQLGHRDLTISFEYKPELVDKVSYHIDDQQQRFFLVVKPQKGHQPLSPDSVQYSYSGADADLIFLIGVNALEDLEHIYFGYETLFQNTPIITINTFEPPVGTVKLDINGASCYSEGMTDLIHQLGYGISADDATNLLLAIENQTNAFASLSTTAETFEMVAVLLRQGARRNYRETRAVNGFPVEKAIEVTPSVAPTQPKRNKKSPKPMPKAGSLQYQPSGLAPGGGG